MPDSLSRVYVLIHSPDYEGETLLGVYCAQGAALGASPCQPSPKGRRKWMGNGEHMVIRDDKNHCFYEVKRMEVE